MKQGQNGAFLSGRSPILALPLGYVVRGLGHFFRGKLLIEAGAVHEMCLQSFCYSCIDGGI